MQHLASRWYCLNVYNYLEKLVIYLKNRNFDLHHIVVVGETGVLFKNHHLNPIHWQLSHMLQMGFKLWQSVAMPLTTQPSEQW